MWLRACEGEEREEWMELRTADFRIKGTETSICLANWDCAAAMFDLTADSTSPPSAFTLGCDGGQRNGVSAKVAGLMKHLSYPDAFLAEGHVNEAQSDLGSAICVNVTSDVQRHAGKFHICKDLASRLGLGMDGWFE